MSRQTLSVLLLTIAIVLLVLAAATLLPFPSPMLSDLGYSALCPFAPWSTLMLLLLAGLSWAVRRHVEAQSRVCDMKVEVRLRGAPPNSPRSGR